MAYFRGMIYFKDVPKVGNLYLDRTLFEFEYDLMVFTCKDRDSNIYFCICTDDLKDYSWIAVPIDEKTLNGIMKNTITIMTPFKTTDGEILIIDRKFGQQDCSYKWYRYEDIDIGELPYKDQYLF